MKKILTLFVGQLLLLTSLHAQYNKLAIPDTLAGYVDTSTGAVTYNLVMQEGMTQFLPGQQTITAGFNGPFLGPTLIFRTGDHIQMNLMNLLNDTTTCHWHGIHLPGVMDGGPHQVIPPGTIWQPYWTVMDSASTFWYHPHLHKHTDAQVRSGLSGLIIVRDDHEAALPLPRTYGVDDIPLILSDRGFDTSNQFDTSRFFGDTAIVNGTLNAVDTVPSRVVRFRILNAAQERLYNLGFSDNSVFYVIGTDGGLVNAPVPVTRYLISPGERVQILVDLTTRHTGASLDLVAYNDSLLRFQPGGIPAGDTAGVKPFMRNKLGHRRFGLVHFVVNSAIIAPYTFIPSALKTNAYWDTAFADDHRVLNFYNGNLNDTPFTIDSMPFVPEITNKYVPLDNREVWTLRNHSLATHVFHIHDIQFLVTKRTDLAGNPGAVLPAEKGWKDVVLVDSNSAVTFVTKFTDFADSLKPYMYHCHMLGHEDGGMMGQFAVVTTPTGIRKIVEAPEASVTIYPNPAADRLFVEMEDRSVAVYYATIFDAVGRTRYMLPEPRLKDGINISALKPGVYYLVLIDSKGNKVSKKFMKQ